MNEKIENLKFILTRLDTYIDSAQNKSNLYLALNTVVLGGIIAILKDLECGKIMNVLLISIAIVSILSILITLISINPYMKNAMSSKKKSVFFFDDIASCISLSEYKILLNKKADEKLLDDMCAQVYSVAKGLTSKYKKLRIAGFLVAFEFILLAIWIFILLITK